MTASNDKQFSLTQNAELARLVFIRFDRNAEAATAAWRRLLQNECEEADFLQLLCYPEHTHSCEGWCQDPGQEHDYQAAVRATQ